MKLNEHTISDQAGEASASRSRLARTNFQLEGFWLLLARGAWAAFVLAELVVLLLTLLATRGQGLTICPVIVSCGVTPATAQALHHLAISPTSYAAYNLVLALLQSLVFLGVGGFLFWRRSNEPLALVASFFLVCIALTPFLPATSYPPEVFFLNIYAPCIFMALGYFLVAFPDGRFAPGWGWLLVVLWGMRAIAYVIPGPFNIAMEGRSCCWSTATCASLAARSASRPSGFSLASEDYA